MTSDRSKSTVTERITLSAIVVLLVLFAGGCAEKSVAPPKPDSLSQFDGVTGRKTLNTFDGLELFAQYWIPSSEQKASVLLLHSTTMHSGAYSELARYLAANSYLVYGLDLRGWGRSEGHGSKGYVASHDRYVSDVKLAIEHLKEQSPEQDLYVIGESLGATVSMYGYLKHDLPFDGMIFSGPGYKPNVELLGLRGPQTMHSLSMGLGAELGEWVPGWPTLPSDIGLRMVIDDPKMQERLLNDPHVSHAWLPAAYLTALSEADAYNREHIQRLDRPLLVLHGKRDMLIPVSSSEEIIKRSSSKDATLKVYDSNHATLLDTKRFKAYKDIVSWLDNRQKSP
ncbi:MAG: alpha/beta fold hydrolase [bacterium]